MTDKIIRVKIEAGNSEQVINQLDSAMVDAGAAADAAAKKTEQLSDSLAKIAPVTNQAGKTIELMGVRLSEADIALGRFIDKTGRVHEATGQFTAGVLASGESVKDFATKVNAANGVNTELTKTAKGVKDAVNGGSDSLGNFGRSAGQAGMQIQQLVGQVQGGVSPFVALSQQASDLGFVLGFPLLGAVVGIGAALAGPLVAAFTEAEDKADAFEQSLKGIINTQEELKANKARVQIAELNKEFEKQQQTIDGLNRQQAQYVELIKQGGSSQAAYASALFQVDLALSSAKEKQDEIAKQISAVGDASISTKATTDEFSSSLNNLTSTLDLQLVALQQGELQGRLYAAAQELTLDSTEDLPLAIREQITAIYELEQAQKAQKEAAQALNAELNQMAQADKQKAEADKQDARRAERDRQRINERIANMHLETQTLSSQTELMRAVRNEQFTQEEADLASQTASRLLSANTEFELIMSNKMTTDEQKVQAEIAFQERIKAINEQYAEGQIELKRYQLNQEIQAYSGFANSAIQLVSAFGSKSFQAQKNAAIATSLVNIAGGVAQALNNPFPANLGFAAKVAAEGATLLNTIKSTNIGSSGGGVGIGSGGASATIPTAPTAAPVVGSFEIAGLSDLQRQLDNLDGDEFLPVSFTRRLVASLQSVQRLEGSA